jgi:hypothetical protein
MADEETLDGMRRRHKAERLQLRLQQTAELAAHPEVRESASTARQEVTDEDLAARDERDAMRERALVDRMRARREYEQAQTLADARSAR